MFHLERFSQVLAQQKKERELKEKEKFLLLNSDPFDSEAQRMIAEEIRWERWVTFCGFNLIVLISNC